LIFLTLTNKEIQGKHPDLYKKFKAVKNVKQKIKEIYNDLD